MSLTSEQDGATIYKGLNGYGVLNGTQQMGTYSFFFIDNQNDKHQVQDVNISSYDL